MSLKTDMLRIRRQDTSFSFMNADREYTFIEVMRIDSDTKNRSPSSRASCYPVDMTLDECPEIDGIRVDLDALRALAHRCDPIACIGRDRGCCETYEVYVDPREMGAIVGSMPNAARYAKNLKRNGAFADPFEDTDGGSCLATNPNGRCVFAYRDKAGASLCSLHSAGIDMGLEPFKVKPKACALWPLYLIEGDTPVLTVQPGALDFPCNKKRRKNAARLHAGVRDIVEIVFGPDFLAKLEAALG